MFSSHRTYNYKKYDNLKDDDTNQSFDFNTSQSNEQESPFFKPANKPLSQNGTFLFFL
jgi:hypothetical protein